VDRVGLLMHLRNGFYLHESFAPRPGWHSFWPLIVPGVLILAALVAWFVWRWTQ
jgi:hypothetical protein